MVVVLISAMNHGLKAERLRALRETLGVERRTLEGGESGGWSNSFRVPFGKRPGLVSCPRSAN